MMIAPAGTGWLTGVPRPPRRAWYSPIVESPPPTGRPVACWTTLLTAHAQASAPLSVSGTLAELRKLLPPAKVEYVERQPTLEEIFLAIVGSDKKERR